MDVQSDKKAIELRRLGYSYADIAKQLKVSRSSVCGWVKNVRLTEAEKAVLAKNLTSKIERARMRAKITIRSKKVFKEKVAFDSAEKEFDKFVKEPLFLVGLGLVSASGLKKGSTFQFSGSDPAFIKIILKWLEKYFGIKKSMPNYRLFVATSRKDQENEEFWVKTLGIPRDNFLQTVYLERRSIKNKDYHGSLTASLSRIEVIRRVISWQKLIMRYYG